MGGALRARAVALLKATGWTLAFCGLGLLPLIVYSFVAAARSLKAGGIVVDQHSWQTLLVQSILLLLGFIPATWLIGVRRLKLTFEDLRWRTGLGASRGPLMGRAFALGGAAAAATLVLGVLIGDAAWVRDQGSLSEYLSRILLTAFVLTPAALSEEVIFRGLPLVLFSRIIGRGAGIVLLALVFGGFHYLNPSVTALGIGNIVLAGIFLGVVFYTPGGIWAAFGAHLGWNLGIAALDAPVSGLPFDIPWLNYVPAGPAWLTGGTFGPEGGVLATAAITLAVMVAARWTKEAAG